MHEKRQFFRIKNNGDIKAKCGSLDLEVIDISSSGMLIKMNQQLPETGVLDIKINHSSMSVHFEVLRKEWQNIALIFRVQEEINGLFLILKQLRDERGL